MSFLLCHDCYTWVEPDENRCPECLLTMDLSAADPPARQLQELMGEIIGRLGEVRIPRRLLPEWGTLYATTRGLFFVPHEIGSLESTASAPLLGRSLMWSLGTLFWSPLLFLWPFVRTDIPEDTRVRVLCPRYLSAEDSPRMPQLLMDHPGAFFLPRQQIRGISQNRSRWIIERSMGRRMQLSPVDSSRHFHQRLSTFLDSSDGRRGGF